MSKLRLKPLKKREKEKCSFDKENFSLPLAKFITPQLALKFICAFLLSRTAFIGGARPLGFSLFAASFASGGAYVCALGSVLGLIFSGTSLLNLGKYIIAIIMFSLIEERFLPEKLKNIKINSIISALCVLLSGFFLLFADMTVGGYPLLYDSAVLVVECATIWACVTAFRIAMPLVFSLRLRRRNRMPCSFCRWCSVRFRHMGHRRSFQHCRNIVRVMCIVFCNCLWSSSRLLRRYNHGTCVLPCPRKN